MNSVKVQVADAALIYPQVVGYVGLTGPNTVTRELGVEPSDPSHRGTDFGCHGAKGLRARFSRSEHD
jgi:hypothetical protein